LAHPDDTAQVPSTRISEQLTQNRVTVLGEMGYEAEGWCRRRRSPTDEQRQGDRESTDEWMDVGLGWGRAGDVDRARSSRNPPNTTGFEAFAESEVPLGEGVFPLVEGFTERKLSAKASRRHCTGEGFFAESIGGTPLGGHAPRARPT
jgi:hypothetical protein